MAISQMIIEQYRHLKADAPKCVLLMQVSDRPVGGGVIGGIDLGSGSPVIVLRRGNNAWR